MEFAQAVGATGCTDGPTPGAVALADAISEHYTGRGYYLAGIYNCRRVAGSTTWSVHAEGRAVDLGVAGALDGLGADLLHLVLTMGDGTLQRVIYDHRLYDERDPVAGRPFFGDPHVDHLHVELSWPAARGEIPLELAIADDDLEEDVPNLICAWRNAQWCVAGDLSSKQGLPTSTDVTALLRVQEGRAYVATTLSDSLMERIPTAV